VKSRYALALSLLLAAERAPGQELDPASPSVAAVRLGDGERIDVDGRLDEAIWQRAVPATDFNQLEPENGAPATERTEVRIAFDRDRLYLGVHCFDSDPARVLGNQMVRDGPLAGDDRFMWALDPYFNQRSGYFFEINPSGAMGDGLLVPAAGGGGGGSTGLGFGVTQSRAWDGIWLARVHRHERGWTAEIEIPFRTLNFNPRAVAWGANFQRTVRRKNEESLWTAYGRDQGLYNLAGSGRLIGIDGASQGVGLDVKPYAIGTYTDAPAAGRPSVFHATAGGDLFYNLTPQLKSNLTINTDFAQTEVDDRQVNLTRFPLFFPEKRDFFLEGSGSFDFSREPASDFTAFFSRRIGLDPRGRPQAIDYGAKLTGQAGRFDLGVLQVRTAAEGDAVGEDFTVFRPRRRLMRQSYAGLIYTRRSTRDSPLPVRQTIGADLELATSRFRGSQNLQFSGFYTRTPVSGTSAAGDDAIYGVRLNYPNDRWNARVSYRVVGRNANPAVGFIERADYRRLNPVVRFGPRPRNHRFIRQVSMETWAELLTDTSNALLGRAFRFTVADVSLHSGDSVSLVVSPAYERLERNFPIGGITLPLGSSYQYTRYTASISTATRRVLSGTASAQAGTFYSGHRRDLSAGVTVRPRPGVLATLTAQKNHVELPDTRFTTTILRAIVNTQFGPFVSLANNLQYDSDSRVAGWQVRFRWILTPGNDLYFVTLNDWLEDGGRYRVLDRSTSTKLVLTRRF
jgi:uncharacterized protein DUF5916